MVIELGWATLERSSALPVRTIGIVIAKKQALLGTQYVSAMPVVRVIVSRLVF